MELTLNRISPENQKNPPASMEGVVFGTVFSDGPCGVFEVPTFLVLFKISDIDVADAQNAHVWYFGFMF